MARPERSRTYRPQLEPLEVRATPTVVVTIGVMPPEVEEGTSAGFIIERSEAAPEPVVVGWETVDGSATAGDDYLGGVGTVTFAPGELSKDVWIFTLTDEETDPGETFSVRLTSAEGAEIDPFLDEASVTIIDMPPEGGGGGGGEDPPGSGPGISITSPTVTEGNAGQTVTMTFTVSLTAASSDAVTMNYATENVDATAGSDYQSTSGSLTFNPGETSKEVQVTVIGDTSDEYDEKLRLTLSNFVNTSVPAGQSVSADGTITDDDDPPVLDVSVTDATEGAPNGQGGQVVFRVSLSEPSGKAVTVNYATTDGSAIGAGLDPQADFVHTSGPVVLTPTGLGYHDITVMILGDYRVEPDELFSLVFTNPQNVIIPQGPGFAVTFINNDDYSPTLSVPPSQTSLEGRAPPAMSISAAVGAGMPGGVTVTAAPLPDGVTFANGAFGGTVHYSAWENSNYTNGLYKIAVTAADEHGNSTSATFDWTITDVALDELTGTEAAGPSPKSVTVGGLDGKYLKTVEAVDLTYTTETAAAVPLAAHVLWRVSKYDSQTSSWQEWLASSFASVTQAPAANSSDAYPIIHLEVGIDVNLDGTLATTEVTHQFDYGPNYSFFGSGITSRRSASSHSFQYVENDAFRISSGLHHELFSSFEFKLDGDIGSIPVAWEIRPSGVSDNDPQIVRGTGNSMTHGFGSGDAGTWIVRFFHDENANGVRDGNEGTDYTSQNANAVGKSITVKPMKVFALNVLYPSQEPLFANITSAEVQAMLSTNSAAAAKRDSFEDYRALIAFELNALDGMNLSGQVYPAVFDGLNLNHVHAHADNHANYQIHLVPETVGDVSGMAVWPTGGSPTVPKVVVIDWSTPGNNTIVHELGHVQGLQHAGHKHGKYIMAAGAYGGPANELVQSDVDPFESDL